jgi:DNA-binding NarL/FixJ family response regulator
MTAAVRVLVVDDHDLFRAGLSAILGVGGMHVVGDAKDGPTAVRAIAETRPDVVLMDIEMPGGDGLAATRQILAEHPDVRVLMLTTFDLDEYVFQALRIGASGFLLKTSPPERLLAAIRACAAGDTPLAPSVTRRLVDTFVRRSPPPHGGQVPAALGQLTPRELDVLRAIARGLSNAEIGTELYLAEPTVKAHVTHILTKLGLRDRVQAVVLAYESGLVL